jgi:hypothetical protein
MCEFWKKERRKRYNMVKIGNRENRRKRRSGKES